MAASCGFDLVDRMDRRVFLAQGMFLALAACGTTSEPQVGAVPDEGRGFGFGRHGEAVAAGGGSRGVSISGGKSAINWWIFHRSMVPSIRHASATR